MRVGGGAIVYRLPLISIFALACAACGESKTENQAVTPVAIPEADPRPIPNSLQPGPAAEDSTPLAEGAIDPKSAQGAAQVVQHFAALIEQRRFAEASTLGEEDFSAALDKDAEIHAQVGSPGAIEGAAGSLYVQVPLRFYGNLGSGKPFSQRAVATLRRVNDVPGATAQQLEWRIYRLDMQQPE
jgi:hypothetical protein